jgi:hypothetical protein
MKRLPRLLPSLLVFGAEMLVLVLVGGCGSNAPPPGPATVRGKLTFNGQPVAGGLVVFAPDPQRGGSGKPASAESGPDGSFQLQLDKSPHIPAGWYRVALLPAPVIPDPLAPPTTLFPAKLARPDLSGLEREVRVRVRRRSIRAVGDVPEVPSSKFQVEDKRRVGLLSLTWNFWNLERPVELGTSGTWNFRGPKSSALTPFPRRW